MSGSLNDGEAVLAVLNLAGISALIEIIGTATLRQEQFIRAKYTERAKNFDETLRFLKSIKFIETDGEQLKLTSIFESDSNTSAGLIRNALIPRMSTSPTEYQRVLANYLRRFQTESGRIQYRPDLENRLSDAGIRNLLMELGVIEYAHSSGTYTVNSECAEIYLWAKNITGPRDSSATRLAARRRSKLGTFAEEAVLDFERKRVGPKFAHRVEHVAATNPFACFDISSVTIEGAETIPRLIEVKAVPFRSYEFFWTATEIEAASLLQNKYFLYLIPVIKEGTLDFANLLMIGNAYEAVRRSSQEWEFEENVVWCRKKTPELSESFERIDFPK
jgi:hypothetical protein